MEKKLLIILGLAAVLLVGGFSAKRFGGVSVNGGGTIQASPFIITTNPNAPTTTAATTTQFFGNVDPQQTNQFDLGDAGLAWRNIYASGTAVFNNVTISGTCTGSGCGGGGGVTGMGVFGTLTTGNILIAQNTSTAGFVTGFNLTTSTSGFYLPGGYTMFASNTVMINGTSTGILAWQSATGTLANLFNLNVSGTIDTASGTGMTCGGTNCRQALLISAQSGTPPAVRGASTSTATYMATNGQVAWLAAFQPNVQSALQWSTPLPNNYDGGTLNCSPNWVSTSTATFASIGWGLRAVAVASGESIDAAWGTTSTWNVTDSGGANVFMSASNTALTIGGTPTGGKEVWFEFSRLAGNNATTTQNLKSIECTFGVNKYNAF